MKLRHRVLGHLTWYGIDPSVQSEVSEVVLDAQQLSKELLPRVEKFILSRNNLPPDEAFYWECVPYLIMFYCATHEDISCRPQVSTVLSQKLLLLFIKPVGNRVWPQTRKVTQLRQCVGCTTFKERIRCADWLTTLHSCARLRAFMTREHGVWLRVNHVVRRDKPKCTWFVTRGVMLGNKLQSWSYPFYSLHCL